MFTIDLFKGRRLPPRSKPVFVALAMIPFAIPVIGTIVLAAHCQYTSAMIYNQRQVISDNQQKIDRFAGDIEQYNRINKQIIAARGQLQSVSAAMKYRIQTTDLMVELSKALPDKLVLSKLDLTRDEERRKETDEKSGNVKYVTVVRRKLKLTVGGFDSGDTNQQSHQYIQNIRASKILGEAFLDVRITARNEGDIDNRPAAFYEIECTLKNQD